MHSSRHFLRAIAAALCLTLSGCIVVDDFNGYWDKGYSDSCVSDIVRESIAENDAGPGDEDLAMRSLTLDGQHFLMLRDHPGDKGGSLIRYRIINGDYVSYRLNENKREDFARQFPSTAIVLTSETATIPVLNEESAGLLVAISKDESYWVEHMRQPYNTLKRPDCTGGKR